MTIIDYLLLGGVVVAAGYVMRRLFIGWLSTDATSPVDTSPTEEREELS